MTLAQIIEADAATLAAITDEEYLVIFKDVLNVTRPELALLARNQNVKAAYIPPSKKAALKGLEQAGFDMSLLFTGKKKK